MSLMNFLKPIEMNKTAVEWLEEQIKNNFDFTIHNKLFDIIEQAKEMEKQQIIDAYQNGDNNGADRIYYHSNRDDKSAEQYYNETFKK